jgi:uncharacterized membrane protein
VNAPVTTETKIHRIEYAVALVLLFFAVYRMRLVVDFSQAAFFFAFMLLAPDAVTFAPYIWLRLSKHELRAAHRFYNAVHTFIFVGIFAAATWLLYGSINWLLTGAWFGHILLDRALGFGLKDLDEKLPSRALAYWSTKFKLRNPLLERWTK